MATFSGHETFPFRYGWLKKGYDAVLKNPKVFSSPDAIVELGVGKNMVNSIKYWGLATQIFEKKGNEILRTEFGEFVFDDKKGIDPYLEDKSTLWLLHWKLASTVDPATTWYLAFNELNKSLFTKDELINDLKLLIQKHSYKMPSDNTLKRDIDVFLRTYVLKLDKELIEESFECPLTELNLIIEDNGIYRFNLAASENIPSSVLLFAILEFWDNNFPKKKNLALDEFIYKNGSPFKVFKMTYETFLSKIFEIEKITNGVISYDETAGLKQIYKKQQIDKYDVLKQNLAIKG
ncbi:DUF4007 family protein [Persephonella sp. IF05-L8]|uniref:DUF4007 family protein n=1 Tax=Persephonella sp. IF05-L8 TaxID=1158338 RepID=UPI000691797E